MKLRLDHDTYTALDLIPMHGADEMFIAAILRIFKCGGIIKIEFADKRLRIDNFEASIEGAQNFDEFPEIAEYIKCLGIDK